MILVSSCLLGNAVRYKGDANPCDVLIKYKDCGRFIAICPEVFGGLSIPRPPSEIVGGSGEDVWQGAAKIINDQGVDVTDSYKNGVLKAAEYCKTHHITAVILKERSPSCGTHLIYDGTFTGTRILGKGVTAAYFAQLGLPLYSEEELTEELLKELLATDACLEE